MTIGYDLCRQSQSRLGPVLPALIIDAHAHVFTRQCRRVPDRRYDPRYEAPLARYLAVLDEQGIAGGVLVQPSFLGTDNSYLLECLSAAPSRLRGIVVVDPAIGEHALDAMAARGVVGIRLNLVAAPADWQPSADDIALAAKVAARGWQIEVQARGPILASALEWLLPTAPRIVVDHFGLPSDSAKDKDPGFTALLQAATTEQVWVKLSAPYRFDGVDARAAGGALMEAFGAGRLLWGSDWPWTQHEATVNYSMARRWPLEGIEPRDYKSVLGETACSLFGFDALAE
jgi:predicted TIM-barrel fold metal-dependent hydrolase